MSREVYTKSKMEITIDFKEDLGVEEINDSVIRDQVGQAIIDLIIDRTQSGKTMDGGSFASYSPKYAQKKGVGVGDVDLTLTSDMLDSLDIIRSNSNSITIGVDQSDQVPKAYNHQVGDTLPKRPWLGVNKDELSDLAEAFSSELEPGPSIPVESNFFSQKTDEDTEKEIEAFARLLAETGLDFG